MGDRAFHWGGLGADKADFVTAAEALGILESLVATRGDVTVETGLQDGNAVARIVQGERWALVSTAGTRWFSLDIDSGHRVRIDDASSTRDETASLLEAFVGTAVAYVTGDMRPERRGWGSIVTVPVGERRIMLRSTWRFRNVAGRRTP